MTEAIRSATIIGGSVAGASYAALFLARGVAIRIHGRSTQPPSLEIPAKVNRKARLLLYRRVSLRRFRPHRRMMMSDLPNAVFLDHDETEACALLFGKTGHQSLSGNGFCSSRCHWRWSESHPPAMFVIRSDAVARGDATLRGLPRYGRK
jgi:hypothetical protein